MNKNNILITIKKELRSIFRDKKTLFMIFGFPFLIALFIFLFGFMEDTMMGENTNTYNIGVNYKVEDVQKEFMKQYGLKYKYYTDLDKVKTEFEEDLIDGYVLYDEEKNIYTIYSDSSMTGMNVTSFAAQYLDDYNEYLGNLQLMNEGINPEEVFSNFEVNIKNIEGEELSSSSFLVELIMNMSLMYIIMAIALAAVNMATSAIAVEKEHGTLETILTLPITTTELIVGKYLANVIIGSIASLIGFALTIVSFSIAKEMFVMYENFSISFIAILFGIIICIVASFLISGLATLITSSAKTYKEAQASGQILNYICVVPIFMSYLEFSVTSTMYFIPILNYTTILLDLYTGNFEYINLFITIGSTILYVIVILWIMIKKFKSEKVLFGV